MKVKIIAEIYTNVDVFPDDVCNSDNIGDYKAQLDCDVDNAALHLLAHRLPYDSDIEIIATEPAEEGIDEYSEFLNRWQSEYNKKMSKYEEKRTCKNLG
jgi:hypothetical protein